MHAVLTTVSTNINTNTNTHLLVHELGLLDVQPGGLDGVDDQAQRVGRVLRALEHLAALWYSGRIDGKVRN